MYTQTPGIDSAVGGLAKDLTTSLLFAHSSKLKLSIGTRKRPQGSNPNVSQQEVLAEVLSTTKSRGPLEQLSGQLHSTPRCKLDKETRSLSSVSRFDSKTDSLEVSDFSFRDAALWLIALVILFHCCLHCLLLPRLLYMRGENGVYLPVNHCAPTPRIWNILSQFHKVFDFSLRCKREARWKNRFETF